jgi:xylulokinase
MYLGLDLGTSGVKALLIDDKQTVIGSAHGDLDVSRPHPGWSEQDPEQWIKACRTAIDGLRADHPKEFSAIAGIGLSGQMHGATLLDEQDQVLRPCILWNDTRSYREAAALDADPAFRAVTGNIVFPGFTAPKLVWVANNEPDIFAVTRKVLLPKDYLRFWLTGEYVSDIACCGHKLARYRRTPLVARTSGQDKPDRRSDAAPCRRHRGNRTPAG